jgi:hypothetical protein
MKSHGAQRGVGRSRASNLILLLGHLPDPDGRALGELAGWYAQHQAARDPAVRFVALLQAALAGGKAHVADRTT